MDLEKFLIDKGLIDENGAQTARQEARLKSIGLEDAIVALGLAPEGEVWRALAKSAGLPFVDLGKGKIGRQVLDLAKPHAAMLSENQAVPVKVKRGNQLVVAIDHPSRTFVADNLGFLLGMEIICAVTTPTGLKAGLAQVTDGAEPVARASVPSKPARASKKRGAQTGADTDDAPIIKLVETTFQEALDMRASDIHIEPYDDRVRIRFRVDGMLNDQANHPVHLHGPMVSRLKIMAGLDIAEKRKPQDGRIQLAMNNKQIDVRTSILPTNNGETVVMRLLDREASLISLEALGFGGDDYAWFQRIIKRPHGIFLVTGPTGSGKTTTLYAALSELNRPDVKIITAEDPIEYHLAGINQCQVRHNIGLSFAKVLRSMLRQAPNIILVGEIRDAETAEIAIQAALTGHLVFSTLHTNDSPSAITRLIDMGVKPFLVAASIQAVMAQRLVRNLCPKCKESYQPADSELQSLGLTPDQARDGNICRPIGCAECKGNGYKGRKGIFEMMELDAELREMVFRGESTSKLSNYAHSSGNLNRLIADGRKKVLSGTTSIEEILRVSVEE